LSKTETQVEKWKKRLELTCSSFSGFLRPIKAFTHFPEAPISRKVLLQQKKKKKKKEARNCVILEETELPRVQRKKLF
jgi:hypothetical protein